MPSDLWCNSSPGSNSFTFFPWSSSEEEQSCLVLLISWLLLVSFSKVTYLLVFTFKKKRRKYTMGKNLHPLFYKDMLSILRVFCAGPELLNCLKVMLYLLEHHTAHAQNHVVHSIEKGDTYEKVPPNDLPRAQGWAPRAWAFSRGCW